MTVLPDAALLDIVKTATATVMELPLHTLQAESRFADDLEADSLAMIEIVEVAEEQARAGGMSIRVDDITLAHLTSLADLVSALRNEAEG